MERWEKPHMLEMDWTHRCKGVRSHSASPEELALCKFLEKLSDMSPLFPRWMPGWGRPRSKGAAQ